jgi:hypothetical protein
MYNKSMSVRKPKVGDTIICVKKMQITKKGDIGTILKVPSPTIVIIKWNSGRVGYFYASPQISDYIDYLNEKTDVDKIKDIEKKALKILAQM